MPLLPRPAVLATLTLLLLSCRLPAQPPAAKAADKDKDGWKKLFDGKSLTGWTPSDFHGNGKVIVKDAAIVMETGSSMTGITYAGKDFPRIDYEVTFEAKKVAGNDFFCTTTFPVGEDYCSFVVGGWGGIFLSQTRRLRPTLCRFISDAFYEGRLEPHPDNIKRRLIFTSPIDGLSPEGVHFLPVPHAGCSQRSAEEGALIKRLYGELLCQQFEDKDGTARPMTPHDILVVSPYNVQVNYLKSILPAEARVGTVDKFQGQEAAVVLVSMATSSAEEMPHNMEFLFSANRLNVAVSRAQCLAAVVANPNLLETSCGTVEQLRLVNKFCQLAAYADDCRSV